MDPANASETPAELGKDIYCPVCGYNLYGAPGEKCPECGYPLANLRSPISQIPWERRRELGRFRGYWKTVAMVTPRNLAFCEEYAKSLRLSDARLFRWVSILHVYIPVLLATIIMCVAVAAKPPSTRSLQGIFPPGMLKPLPPLVNQACTEVWPAVAMNACLLLYLAAATSAPSYFFHPRSVAAQQQINGAAMSFYACGPLAYSFVTLPALLSVIVLTLIASLTRDALGTTFDASFVICSVMAAAIPVIFWWWNLVRIAHRTMPQLRYRAAGVAIGVPLLWLGLATVLLLLVPVAAFSVLVALASFGG